VFGGKKGKSSLVNRKNSGQKHLKRGSLKKGPLSDGGKAGLAAPKKGGGDSKGKEKEVGARSSG